MVNLLCFSIGVPVYTMAPKYDGLVLILNEKLEHIIFLMLVQTDPSETQYIAISKERNQPTYRQGSNTF